MSEPRSKAVVKAFLWRYRGRILSVLMTAVGAVIGIASDDAIDDVWPEPTPKPVPVAPDPPADDEPTLVDLHNEYRASKGLSPLEASEVLDQYAKMHAADMAYRRSCDHAGWFARTERIQLSFGDRPVLAFAENVAAGHRSDAAAMESWKRSKVHNANMLGDFSHAGFGERQGYRCVIFARIK